jgi:hypothetical protein
VDEADVGQVEKIVVDEVVVGLVIELAIRGE